MGWVIAACGMYVVAAAVVDWEWFMNHWKSKVLVRVFGRTGARVFYGILGAGLVVVGVLMATGVIQAQD